MLEGKELEGKIGKFGGYSADIDDKGFVEVALNVKIDLLVELHKLVKSTGNSIDDALVEMIAKAMGREADLEAIKAQG